MRSRLVLVCVFGLGCGLKPYMLESASGGEASSSGSTGDATLGGSVTGAVTSTGGMAEETGTGSTAGEGSTTDAVEACPSRGTGGTKECDQWVQDCPEGYKCMPYSGDGDNAWESLKCVPVMPDAGGLNEPCTVVGCEVSGIDDCALGYMCWNVDPETGMGKCVEQCKGSPDQPHCDTLGALCVGTGVLTLCLVGCHPLEGCPDRNDVCVPNPMDAARFLCAIDKSGQEGQAFDVCEFVNACDSGLMCGNPQLADECDQAATGCCLPFCEIDAPNCPGVGLECLPWYEEGMAPSGFEELGVCGIPQ